jgi:hypothetical protein
MLGDAALEAASNAEESTKTGFDRKAFAAFAENLCHPGSGVCASCAPSAAAERISKAGERGRILAQTPTVRARIAETQRRNAAARSNWDPSSQPSWLNEEAYVQRVQPLLAKASTSAISRALGVSWPYARNIRIGKCRPHSRHWEKLAQLVGVSPEG